MAVAYLILIPHAEHLSHFKNSFIRLVEKRAIKEMLSEKNKIINAYLIAKKTTFNRRYRVELNANST